MSFMDKLEALINFDHWNREDEYFRGRHTASAQGVDYDRTRPAYQYGFAMGSNPEYRGRNFADVESQLSGEWDADMTKQYGAWNDVRGYVSTAYERGQERTITVSEEELAIGKRTVSAGEVAVTKTVETEHVVERVPLRQEEVTIERRPVEGGVRAAADTQIGEETIRVPVSREEVVVEKRPVVKEEIVISKQAHQETETVEADLRKERAHVEDTTRTVRGTNVNDRDAR